MVYKKPLERRIVSREILQKWRKHDGIDPVRVFHRILSKFFQKYDDRKSN